MQYKIKGRMEEISISLIFDGSHIFTPINKGGREREREGGS